LNMGQKRSDVFQEARESLLGSLADAVANFDRGQRAADQERRPPNPASEDRGDFLQEVLELNVQYLNQLARLGSSYSIVASRTLEKLYDYFGPQSDEETPGQGPSANPILRIATGEVRHVTVELCNPNSFSVDFELVVELLGRPKASPDVASFAWSGEFRGARQFFLLPKETLRLNLSVRVLEKMRLDRRYRMGVRVAHVLTPGDPRAIAIDPATISIKRVQR
jgi:hypothetical protein